MPRNMEGLYDHHDPLAGDHAEAQVAGRSLFPRAHATSSPWQAQPSRYANHLSAPALPETAQVAIIGTGLSGVSTAWHILHGEPDIRVTLLEARTLCSAASGRNGGHLTCDLFGFAPGLKAAGYTDTEIAAHGQFEIDNFHALTNLIHEHKIDCEYAPKQHYTICASEEEFKAALQCVTVVKASHGPLDSLRVWKNPEASAMAGMPCHGLIQHAYSASVNPYKLVTGMLDLLMQRFPERIALFTNTLVEKVDGQVLRTSRGSVKCDAIVLATNGYTASILPEMKDVIVPVRGQVMSQQLARSVQNCSFSLGGEYLSQRPDGAMVLGGGRRFADRQELHNSDDTSLSTPVSSFLHDFARKLGKKTSKDSQEDGQEWEWTGIMGFAKLGIPLAMQLPAQKVDANSTGRTFVIAGFTGHGMPRIYLSAAHIADLILGKTDEQHTKASKSLPAGYDVIKHMVDSDLADR